MNTDRRIARLAGILYLVVGIFGGFAIGFVYPKIYVAGNAATTAANVLANSGLVRMGILADMVQAVAWIFLALALYGLCRHVSEHAALAMVVLTAIGAGITCLNTVLELEGMRVATDSQYAATLGTGGANALVLLLVDAHNYGLFAIEQIFFGLWLLPLGYLAYKSGLFPKALGVVLIIGGASYLADVLALFLVPDLDQKFHALVVAPIAAIAEIWMLGYLLLKGVRVSTPVRPPETRQPHAAV